jgi:hypothetical protein
MKKGGPGSGHAALPVLTVSVTAGGSGRAEPAPLDPVEAPTPAPTAVGAQHGTNGAADETQHEGVARDAVAQEGPKDD